MQRILCKWKIHGASVTEANLHYTGSLTVDSRLMKAADLLPYEQVHVVDINNGARLVTYCIEGAPGSGVMCVNGAAARLVAPGDRIIVISYAQYSEEELARFAPKVVKVDEDNRVVEVLTDGVSVGPDDTLSLQA